MSKIVRLILFVFVFVALVVAQPAEAMERFHVPVDGEVTDAFRPPTTPYGPGNRGWEFATTPGDDVSAVAAGTVTFAGQVGGVLNVVVKHSDGLLTTYSKLASITILNGMVVAAGDKLGTTTADTYFGVRSNGEYVDPAPFFQGRPYLVSNTAPRAAGTRELSKELSASMSAGQRSWLQAPPAYWPQLRATLGQLRL